MRLLFVLIILLNTSSLFGQSKNNFTFYDEYNNKLLKVSQSFASSKDYVQNIFSLKSEEKSRVLILDYVEAHDDLFLLGHLNRSAQMLFGRWLSLAPCRNKDHHDITKPHIRTQ